MDTSKLILVAEDNQVNQRVALLELKHLGLAANAVANGNEVLQALEQIPYSLILMDCQMPEMDGFQTTKEIRQKEAGTGKHIPIIAMTAQAMDGDRGKCLEAGMDDYISKPIDDRRLAGLLARFIPLADPEPACAAAPAQAAGNTAESLIDFEFLRNEFGCDQALHLLQLFQSSCNTLEQTISAAFRAQDLKAIKALLHELKGSSACLKAAALHTVVVYFEQATIQSNWEAMSKLKETFHTVLDQTRQYIDSIFKQQAS